MKKTVPWILTAIFVVAVAALCIYFSVTTLSSTDYAMNTVINITVKSRNPEEDIKAAIAEVKRIDALMSATNSKSDICKINSAPVGKAVEVSSETCKLISLALEISEKSDGAFDISVNSLSELWNINSPNPQVPPEEDIQELLECTNYKDIELDLKNNTVTLKKEKMSISLGAIAKGYAADCVAKLLKDRGVSEAMIDLGGNVYVVGGEKTIGIQTPFEVRGEYFTTCKVADKAVVTSGAYERYFEKDGKRYHHILNPHTGYPAQSGISSVTVISDNSALADGLTTAIYVMGEEKARSVVEKYSNVEVIILTDVGKTIRIN